MARALVLAARAKGRTSPNPMVGTVIVRNGRIISEGYHRKAGTDHAEVVALKKAGKKAAGATAYVTLEPCCHTGCTGPCSDALIKAGIARVVFAAVDPNPIVKGKGLRRLRRAGIDVSFGLMRNEAEELNEVYFGYHRLGRPFVTLKMAQTLDGRIATLSGQSQWISGPETLKMAHQLRAESDGVLVGAGTVRHDDPSLTVRLVRGSHPYRIVLTGSGRLPKGSKLFQNNEDARTVVASTAEGIAKLSRRQGFGGLTFWALKSDRAGRPQLLDLLAKADAFGLRSLLVEGGAEVATTFLKAGLVDRLVLVVAPMLIGHGRDTIGELGIRTLDRAIRLDRVSVHRIGKDAVVTGYPKYGSK